jgi:hypothetical protein
VGRRTGIDGGRYVVVAFIGYQAGFKQEMKDPKGFQNL